ncbi:MAG: hypothetical protein IKG23_13765 [Clostridia bacterium]|nr:hypothetical protein [Clostridia bacterium]
MNMPKIDMSSIVSILLAIALAFTSMGGMTADLEDTVSFDAKITLDADSIMTVFSQAPEGELTEEAQQKLEEQKELGAAIADIVSCLTLRGAARKDAAEVVLLAGDSDSVALSIGMKKDDTGVTVASSMLSSDVIFISDELLQEAQEKQEKQKQQMQELQQMLAEIGAASEGEEQTTAAQSLQSAASGLDAQTVAGILEKLDKDQIVKDIEEAGKKLSEGIEAKKGETETGEFTVDDMTFVSKTPVNMTYPEFVEFLLTSAKELAAAESLKPLIDATGRDIGAEIDKAVEELKNQPETDWPEVFDLTAYTDADNCAYYVCDMTKPAKETEAEPEELHIAYGEVEGQIRVKFIRNQAESKLAVNLSGVRESTFDLSAAMENKAGHTEIHAGCDEAGNFNVFYKTDDGKQAVKIEIKAEQTEADRHGLGIAVYLNGAETPMIQVSGSYGKGDEMVSVFEGEKITATPAEKLMDGESTESASLGLKAGAGLLKTVMVVTKNVPQKTADWINAKIKELISPKPKTTEAPQEQPVTDGE